ncbi:MAG: glycosyltransferase, partial [Pirellulales bacterium]
MEFGKKRIFLVDMLAGDHGHLLNDDLVLSRCLFPLASRFCLASSSASIVNVHNILGVNVKNIGTFRPSGYLRRLRLIWLAITLNCSGFDHIFLQSFEEISALLFMFLRPAKKVHLVVTNNLRPDRLDRHPFLGSWVLRSLIKRATSLIVHSKYEKELILKLSPKTKS